MRRTFGVREPVDLDHLVISVVPFISRRSSASFWRIPSRPSLRASRTLSVSLAATARFGRRAACFSFCSAHFVPATPVATRP